MSLRPVSCFCLACVNVVLKSWQRQKCLLFVLLASTCVPPSFVLFLSCLRQRRPKIMAAPKVSSFCLACVNVCPSVHCLVFVLLASTCVRSRGLREGEISRKSGPFAAFTSPCVTSSHGLQFWPRAAPGDFGGPKMQHSHSFALTRLWSEVTLCPFAHLANLLCERRLKFVQIGNL